MRLATATGTEEGGDVTGAQWPEVPEGNRDQEGRFRLVAGVTKELQLLADAVAKAEGEIPGLPSLRISDQRCSLATFQHNSPWQRCLGRASCGSAPRRTEPSRTEEGWGVNLRADVLSTNALLLGQCGLLLMEINRMNIHACHFTSSNTWDLSPIILEFSSSLKNTFIYVYLLNGFLWPIGNLLQTL